MYKRDLAYLTVGVDDMGYVYSFVEKEGKIIVHDMYIRIPTEVELATLGWVRINGQRN